MSKRDVVQCTDALHDAKGCYFFCYMEIMIDCVFGVNELEFVAQRAGLELMDMMSVYQEGAYERLCR